MRIKLTVLFLLLSMSCFARVGVPTPSEPRPQVDDQGTLLSDTNPAPVKIIGVSSITVSIGAVEDGIATTNAKLDILNASLTQSLRQVENAASGTTSAVNINNASLSAAIASTNAILIDLDDALTTTMVIVTATSQDIAALADRNFLAIQNAGTQTIHLNAGGTPATTDGWQIYPQGSITFRDTAAVATFSIVCDTALSSKAVIVQGKK